MKKFEKLGEATTPEGTLLTLHRHDGDYLLRADGGELMSTRRHHSEDRLAEMVCEPLRETPNARVLIGGLGLGFTLKAALRSLGDDARVEIAEIVGAVIEWNRNPEYGLGHDALLDPRVTLHHADVGQVLAANPEAYDAVMLDVDNGAEAIVSTGNDRLYGAWGIRAAKASLRPGGKLAYWCAGAEPAFVRALRGAGLTVDASEEPAYGAGGPMHALYLAYRPG
ncbi:MAG: spermidine synthase [Gemmatimonadaceae bacterium]